MNDSVSAGAHARGMRGDHVAGAVLMAFSALVAWDNRSYPLGSLASPGPGSVPLMLALILGGLGLLIIVRGAASPLLNSIEWSEARRGFVLLLACGVATFVLERIGYRLSMIALLVFMLGVVERKKPLPTALVSIGFAYGSYFMFATLLKVQLPLGPWGL